MLSDKSAAPNSGRFAARKAAVTALVQVHGGGWANLAAKHTLPGSMPPADKAFAAALLYGCVERLITLDYLLTPRLKKGVAGLDAEVRAILECGLYQMMYMRVPAGAAVNESVKLARAFGKSSAAGLVNAVLRALAAGPFELTKMVFVNEAERVSVQYSVSKAVARALMEALPGEYEAFLAASFSNGCSALRVNTLKTDADTLKAALKDNGWPAEDGPLPNSLVCKMPGGVAGSTLFRQGMFHVQGLASQLVCACVGARPGDTVLDVCAAPGGKSATLAQALGGGAGLTACDVHPHRVQLIEKTLARLGIEGARVLQNDATVYNPALCGQSRVLCDVPCSGLGVLAQKPDLRLADGGGFEALPALQLKVLRTAARYVQSGGRLVYSTCTVRGPENREVVCAFLGGDNRFSLVPPPVAPPGAVMQDGMMTLLPNRSAAEGFFVATMERL